MGYFRKALLLIIMQLGFDFLEFIPLNFIGVLGFVNGLWLLVKPELLVLVPIYALRLVPMWLEYAFVRICDRINIEIWSVFYVAPSVELQNVATGALNPQSLFIVGLLLTLARKNGN